MKNVITQQGGDVKGVSIIAFAQGFSIGDIFVFLGEWILALYMNIIYVARKIVIMFLMVLAPVAAISLLYAKTRFFFGVWFKEYVGNIFLQSVHAIVLGVFALIAANTGAGMIFKLGMLIMFVPVSGLLSKWLNMGDSSSMLGRTAAMTGLGSIASLAMMAKGMNDLRKGGTGRVGGSGGGTGTNSDGSDLASDSGTTGLTSLMTGGNSAGWGRLKRMSGMIGMGTGALAGSVLGPMGAAVGGGIGKKVGELAPQLARQVAVGGVTGAMDAFQGIRNLPNRAQNPTGNVISDTLSGAKEAWNDLSLRRETAGRVGELVGGMVGLGSQGRALGQMMSGVSRERIMDQEYGNRDLQDYASKYPGSNVQWRQNSNGSAFYRQDTDGNWQQISPTGAADSSLKNGEERRIDYQFNNRSPWIRQENGSYTLGTTNPSFSPGARAQGIGTNAYGGAGSVARTAGTVMNSAGAAGNTMGTVASMTGATNAAVENIAEQILSGTAQVASTSHAPDINVGSQNPLQASTPTVGSQSATVATPGATPSMTGASPAPTSVNPADGGSLAHVAGSNPTVNPSSTTVGVNSSPSPVLVAGTGETGSASPIPSGPSPSASSSAPPVSSGVPHAPAGTVGEIVSHHVQGQSTPVYDTRQVVGLAGSTAQLARTSGAYVVGADGQQFDDRRINPASINPDAYFANNTQGRGDQRSGQDRMADVVHSVGVGTAQAWTRSTALVRPNRHRGVV
ncbi:hypothetical protein [Aneurinibacillus tyrosinisolvens]|uniref:hypothetical protein n=1 Tax=Aneurinibacillus tyrosinisolvens TaxID=1443435 RepID=UPI00063F24F5|nr:hypothetical protein [Aneurinibacillus tyrosinisolvens]